MKTFEDIAQEILRESVRAAAMWPVSFDRNNTLNDWVTYIGIYTGKAASMGNTREDVIRGLRKAAGLCLSALYHAENDLLAPRHYEEQPRPKSLPEIEELFGGKV